MHLKRDTFGCLFFILALRLLSSFEQAKSLNMRKKCHRPNSKLASSHTLYQPQDLSKIKRCSVECLFFAPCQIEDALIK